MGYEKVAHGHLSPFNTKDPFVVPAFEDDFMPDGSSKGNNNPGNDYRNNES